MRLKICFLLFFIEIRQEHFADAALCIKNEVFEVFSIPFFEKEKKIERNASSFMCIWGTYMQYNISIINHLSGQILLPFMLLLFSSLVLLKRREIAEFIFFMCEFFSPFFMWKWPEAMILWLSFLNSLILHSKVQSLGGKMHRLICSAETHLFV